MEFIQQHFVNYLKSKYQEITEKEIEKAKICYLDYLAVTEAGAKYNKTRWDEYIKHIPDGNVDLIGYDKKTDGKTACIINAFNCHTLELDDGSKFGMIHLGATIITALYSAKIENNISDLDFYKGIIIGYEAACRLSISMNPSHKKKGFHTTGTMGTIGSALAIAFALKMSDSQIDTVISASTINASGMLRIQEQKSELKPYNPSHAAMDGLSAAYMGFTNFCGSDDILGGENGFIKIFSDENKVEKLTEQNDYFEIDRIYIKNYAACQYCHSSIEAGICLKEKIQDINKIEKIDVFVNSIAIKGHNHTEILSISSAKLSIPYCVALALIIGKADSFSFTEENIKNREILDIAKKVNVLESEEFSKNEKLARAAEVVIAMNDGNILKQRVEFAKGTYENPMTKEDIKRKVVNLLGEEKSNRLLNI